MYPDLSRGCLTRVMTDDDRGVEVAQLQWVMQRIQRSLGHVPEAHREYLAHALLDLAVSTLSNQTEARTRAGRPGVWNAP